MIAKLRILLSITLVAVTLAVLTATAFETFSLKALDVQFRWHLDAERRDPRVVIVAVDQASLDYFERENISFPWPRSLYNPIIDFATAAGARAVIFDILFNNQSSYGVDVDRAFATAIAESGIVYLSAALAEEGSGSAALAIELGLPFVGEPPQSIRRQGLSPPVEPLLSASAGIGLVTQRPDEDGIYRRARPFSELGSRLLPALGLAPLAAKAPEVLWSDGSAVEVGGLSIPVDEKGEVGLRFRGGMSQFRRFSALEMIQSATLAEQGREGSIKSEDLRGAYVFVAYTAPGLFDLKPTPVRAISPGVLVHATLLANILDEDFMRPAPRYLQWIGAWLLTLAVSAAILWGGSVLSSGGLAFAAAALGLAPTQISFVQGYWWDLPQLLFSLFVGVVLAAVYRYHAEGRQRRFLHNAFSHYVSPSVVQQIVRSPRPPELGGEKREITVLFSDLAGFTTLSEGMEPQALVSVLNGYTTMMADTITRHEGTVDKFIGDAVMAFWGAPLEQEDQSDLALRAALACLDGFGDYCRSQCPGLDLGVRIGIDRGECVVGNMGSLQRFDYTAIGDTVNQASRLEGLNKFYGSRLLVGEAAWRQAGAGFVGRQVDFLTVKGKSLPVRVFEALAARDSATAEDELLCAGYEAAFAAYLQRNWDRAQALLEAILEKRSDRPSEVLLRRVERYRTAPPAADWDGSYAHTTK